jgi:hypothetical protein
MARSGSYDFNIARKDVINAAIRIITGRGGKISEAMTVKDEHTNASSALNMMIKAWQAKGIGLWKNAEIMVFPAYNTRSYSLGPTGDHATEALVETEISTAGSATDTTLTVDSITGISNADKIGIELDDNTLQWTTVSGAPSGSTITIAAALTDDVAVDNNVYTYTTIIQRPLSISEGRLYRDDGTETPLEILTREKYMDLSNKTTTGSPNQVYYDPQLDDGVLYVWPVFDSVEEYLKLTARMPIQDMDATANNFDFPQEWFEALKFNLAYKISSEYEKIDINNLLWIKGLADESFGNIEAFDAELGSVYFDIDETGFRL